MHYSVYLTPLEKQGKYVFIYCTFSMYFVVSLKVAGVCVCLKVTKNLEKHVFHGITYTFVYFWLNMGYFGTTYSP